MRYHQTVDERWWPGGYAGWLGEGILTDGRITIQDVGLFNYKALTRNGRVVRGTVSAADDVHLSRQLASANLELVACKRLRYVTHPALRKYFTRVTTRDLIQLFTQLEQLQAAGVPLLDSLKNVRQATANHRLHDILIDIHRNIAEGLSLSETMAHNRDVFDDLCISIVAAGEETGELLAAYRYLIAHLKWADEMSRRVRAATRYPMVVITIVVVAVLVMMGFVVPQITAFFEFIDEDKGLPFATVALVATSEFFKAYWWALAGGILTVPVAIVTGHRLSGTFAYKTDRLLLAMPLFGPLVRKINIARFLQTASALYAAGIPFLGAIKTAGTTVSNRVLAGAVEEIRQDMKGGKPFSEALMATGEFPAMVPLMISTAEETGKMSDVLEQIAAFYNTDVDDEIQKMIAMIEPALTVLLGGIILWIAIGVFGPIYELFEDLEI